MFQSIRRWWQANRLITVEVLLLLEDRLERSAARRHNSIISALRAIMDRNEQLAAAVTNLETKITEVGNKITEEAAEVTTAIDTLKAELGKQPSNAAIDAAIDAAIVQIIAAAARLGDTAVAIDAILPDVDPAAPIDPAVPDAGTPTDDGNTPA